MKNILCFLVVLMIAACSRYPADVERALGLAGDNRAELEKVLEHYRQQPEDSMKLRAAYFLIANMPYHFTAYDTLLDSFKTYIENIELKEGLMNNYVKKYGPITGKIEMINPDLYQMTSEYLIRNIDFSFQVWRDTPWSQYFSFDIFCEEILPYRLNREPLEYWKEEYYQVFRPIIDTMVHNQHPEEICKQLIQYIHNQGWTWVYNINDFQNQGLGGLFLLKKKFGNCKEQCEFITYMLRSIGIPSGIDMYIKNPEGPSETHHWNYTRDITGKHLRFNFYDIQMGRNGEVRKYGKIYRKYYALQQDSPPIKYKNKYIPPGELRNVLLRDVSSDYFPDTHISVSLETSGLFRRKDAAYLCVVDRDRWIPITMSIPKSGVVEFRNVEPNILYQVRLIDSTQNVAASNPFIFHDNENVQFFDADAKKKQSMILLRKYRMPYILPNWVSRAVGGRFQGANRSDFRDSKTLHTIREPADFNYVDIQLKHPEKFKYVRYLSARGGYNNMAEVQFYSGGKLLHGKVIGTGGTQVELSENSRYSVFDGDPLSFFNAQKANGAWAGLELDKAYQIEAIRYMFRNDDNNIRPGDLYELLFYKKGKWVSTRKQIADTIILQYYNVPANTLYWLRNHTRGVQERPFTYEKGKKIWW